MKKHIFILLSTCLLINHSFSADKELFPGESKLSGCKILTPISMYYNTNDKAGYLKHAKEYKDVQLVLLSYNKRSNTATYTPYYLVVEEKTNQFSIYLESPEDHNKKEGKKKALFLTDNPRIQRFYVADCFTKIVAEDPGLKSIIKQ